MKSQEFAPLIILAILACHDEPVAPSSAAGLTLALALAHTEVQRGQPDSVFMILTNTNPHSVALNGGVCEPRPYVSDAHGGIVVPAGGDWICIAIVRRLVLTAGQRYTQTFVWQTGSFAPGNYSVYATFTAEEVKLATPAASVRLN